MQQLAQPAGVGQEHGRANRGAGEQGAVVAVPVIQSEEVELQLGGRPGQRPSVGGDAHEDGGGRARPHPDADHQQEQRDPPGPPGCHVPSCATSVSTQSCCSAIRSWRPARIGGLAAGFPTSSLRGGGSSRLALGKRGASTSARTTGTQDACGVRLRGLDYSPPGTLESRSGGRTPLRPKSRAGQVRRRVSGLQPGDALVLPRRGRSVMGTARRCPGATQHGTRLSRGRSTGTIGDSRQPSPSDVSLGPGARTVRGQSSARSSRRRLWTARRPAAAEVPTRCACWERRA